MKNLIRLLFVCSIFYAFPVKASPTCLYGQDSSGTCYCHAEDDCTASGQNPDPDCNQDYVNVNGSGCRGVWMLAIDLQGQYDCTAAGGHWSCDTDSNYYDIYNNCNYTTGSCTCRRPGCGE